MHVAGSHQCLLGADGWPDACLDLTLVPTEDWTAQSFSLHTLTSCSAAPLLTGASICFDSLWWFFFSIEPYGAIIRALILGAVILLQHGRIYIRSWVAQSWWPSKKTQHSVESIVIRSRDGFIIGRTDSQVRWTGALSPLILDVWVQPTSLCSRLSKLPFVPVPLRAKH